MHHLVKETAGIVLILVLKKGKLCLAVVSMMVVIEEHCTALKELHETKTKALKTVNTFCYCLQAKYSFNSLLFAQLILAIALL